MQYWLRHKAGCSRSTMLKNALIPSRAWHSEDPVRKAKLDYHRCCTVVNREEDTEPGVNCEELYGHRAE